MDLKISLKTILLFAALFILGTMILGFYSCSGDSSPVVPQVVDDTAVTPDTSPGPGTASEDAVTTSTTPGANPLADDSGTIVGTFDLLIDETGNATLIELRESQFQEWTPGDVFDGTISYGDFEIIFSPFTETVPGTMESNVTWINHAETTIKYPRIALVVDLDPIGEPADDADVYGSAVVMQGLNNPDIYISPPETLSFISDFTYLPVAVPCVFIADNAREFELKPGEDASHDISIDTVSEIAAQVTVFLIAEVDPTDDFSSLRPPDDGTGELGDGSFIDDGPFTTSPVPTLIEVSLDEDPSEGQIGDPITPFSQVEVIINDTHSVWRGAEVLVEQITDGEGNTAALNFIGFLEPGHKNARYSGAVKYQPSVDGPFDLLISIWPDGSPAQDRYYWIVSY